MWNKRVLFSASSFFWVILVLILGENVSTTTTAAAAQWKEQSLEGLGPLVKKYQRSTIFSTEYGDVSEAVVTDGNEPFQLHFITLEPNSLFLPVLLHYDMVFYVQTGSGKLSYLDEDEKEHTELKQGDVHRLRSGAVFFIQSDLENERQKLRVIAIFDNPEYDLNEPASSGPYSSISDLVLGFDESVLRAIFKAPTPLIEEIRNGTRPGAIIHGLQKKEKKKKKNTEHEYEFMEEMYNILDLSNKHKKSKLFNLNDEDPDFKNEHGWSTIVDKKKYAPFRGSRYGVFMVYLTEGSMMGPHWNPMAAEVVVPAKGKGMIQVVCPRMMDVSKCSDSRFLVEEGDLLVVPRFHAMAQMAFSNETFVFMGFSTSTRTNHPQYLAGKASVQRTLDKHIMAASLGINVSTYEKLMDKQDKSIILDCTSCAEEEWMRLVEETEERRREEEKAEEEARKREEERRREEEEARKREEEEAQRKREEEEAAQKKREEEEWKKKEQEERERQEEQQKQEEERERQEQQRRQEEEERKRRERQQQEEEERERQERQRQEEEERKRREQQQQEEEEEERERQEQQQKQEQEEREREQQQKQREQEEWAAREREREQEAEREREAQAEREEEAAREKEEEEAAEGQRPWGGGQEESEEEWQEQQQPEEREKEEQEEWTDKERKHEQAQKEEARRKQLKQHKDRNNGQKTKKGQEES